MAGKNKNYKKQSILKSAVFLILAAIVLFCMKPESSGSGINEPVQPESTTAYIVQGTVAETTSAPKETKASTEVSEDGEYSDKDHVALYIHTYGKLPSNYISKTKAQKQGWEAAKGNLWDVLPGKSIGGGPFGNNEGLLPEKDGRSYKECDIDYDGGGRNGKRIVFSNDGLIYYTDDHYNTFELLYGEP